MDSAKTEAGPPKPKTEPVVKEELNIKDLQKIIGANKAEQRKTISLTTSAVKEETKDLSLFSTFQSVLDQDPNLEIRVARKEQAVKHGLAYLERLSSLIEQHIITFPECQEWLDQSKAIIEKAEAPRILIGLMGYTGSGKSSLLNALIDEEMIVACNAMRASTSVAIEISWNNSDNPAEAYTAEIEFVKPEEWANEFEILADDIRNRPEGEQLGVRSGSEAGIAYAKISTVYPGSDVTELLDMSAEQLLEEQNLSTILGQKRYIKEATAKKFYSAIKVYIDSSNKGSASQPAYWPLVRCVKIFLKARLLENGLVLVDLPGLGDSNAGRAKIAERYMTNLDHAWIVADIVRAVDDQVAKDLMGKSFRRRLLMDDKYDDNFVALIMTKTDQVNIHEVIDSLDLDESALRDHLAEENRLRQDLENFGEQLEKIKQQHTEGQRQLRKFSAEEKQIRIRVRESPSTGQKRTFNETSMSQSESVPKSFSKRDSTRLEEIAQERKKLKASQKEGTKAEKALEAGAAKTKNKQSSLMASMRTICIDERNKYTQTRLQQDFEGGFFELEEELRETGESIGNGPSKRKGGSRSGLKSFCISSKAYQKMCGRFKRDSEIQGFPNVDLTQIPQLREFANRSTLPKREEIADGILTELILMNISIKVWGEKKDLQSLSLSQRDALKIALDEHFKIMKQSTEKCAKNTVANIKSDIKRNLEDNLKSVEETGIQKAEELCKTLSSGEISAVTWKAICKRKGVFKNSKKIQYDWNEEFSEAYLESLTLRWTLVLHKNLSRYHTTLSEKLIEALRIFSRDLDKSASPICGPGYKPLKTILAQLPHLEDQIRSKVATFLKLGKTEAAKIHEEVTPVVKTHLNDFYVKCGEEKGNGMGKRMKRHLLEHTNENSEETYKDVSSMIRKGLKKLTTILSNKLISAANASQSKMRRDLLQMTTTAGVRQDTIKPDPARLEFQAAVLAELEGLQSDWKKDMEDPSVQLKAVNPLERFDHDSEGDDEGEDKDEDEDDESESGGEDDESGAEASNEDSGSENGEDNYDDGDEEDDDDNL